MEECIVQYMYYHVYSIGAFVTGIYGMNLKNHYEEDSNMFIIVVLCVVLGVLIMFIIIGWLLKSAGLFGSRLILDLSSTHHQQFRSDKSY